MAVFTISQDQPAEYGAAANPSPGVYTITAGANPTLQPAVAGARRVIYGWANGDGGMPVFYRQEIMADGTARGADYLDAPGGLAVLAPTLLTPP